MKDVIVAGDGPEAGRPVGCEPFAERSPAAPVKRGVGESEFVQPNGSARPPLACSPRHPRRAAY